MLSHTHNLHWTLSISGQTCKTCKGQWRGSRRRPRQPGVNQLFASFTGVPQFTGKLHACTQFPLNFIHIRSKGLHHQRYHRIWVCWVVHHCHKITHKILVHHWIYRLRKRQTTKVSVHIIMHNMHCNMHTFYIPCLQCMAKMHACSTHMHTCTFIATCTHCIYHACNAWLTCMLHTHAHIWYNMLVAMHVQLRCLIWLKKYFKACRRPLIQRVPPLMKTTSTYQQRWSAPLETPRSSLIYVRSVNQVR